MREKAAAGGGDDDNKLKSRERISWGGRERVGGLSDDWLL